MDDTKIQKIIDLIQQSVLDDTIKSILIRDLKSEGLTEFLRQQIEAYCLEGLKQLDEEYKKAAALLNSRTSDPAQ